MKLTDGKKTVNIKIYDRNGIDWAEEFFDAGLLEYDEETDTHIVPDVEYCIEQLHDMLNCEGDFSLWEDTESDAVIEYIKQ